MEIQVRGVDKPGVGHCGVPPSVQSPLKLAQGVIHTRSDRLESPQRVKVTLRAVRVGKQVTPHDDAVADRHSTGHRAHVEGVCIAVRHATRPDEWRCRRAENAIGVVSSNAMRENIVVPPPSRRPVAVDVADHLHPLEFAVAGLEESVIPALHREMAESHVLASDIDHVRAGVLPVENGAPGCKVGAALYDYEIARTA